MLVSLGDIIMYFATFVGQTAVEVGYDTLYGRIKVSMPTASINEFYAMSSNKFCELVKIYRDITDQVIF